MPRAARVVRAKRAVRAVQVGKWAYLVSTAGACLQGMLHAARQREQHLAKMGRGLNTAVNAYNAAVGSYDGRVMPEGRRLKELGIKDSPKRKLEAPPPVEGVARIPQNSTGRDRGEEE